MTKVMIAWMTFWLSVGTILMVCTGLAPADEIHRERSWQEQPHYLPSWESTQRHYLPSYQREQNIRAICGNYCGVRADIAAPNRGLNQGQFAADGEPQ